MPISQELIAAFDDLIQVAASASAALREAIEHLAGPRTWEMDAVASSQGVIDSVKAAARTEQSMPTLLTSARDAVSRLQEVAGRIGQMDLAGSLKMKLDAFTAQMRADGLGPPWLTILGIGAGAIAAWFLWKQYSKKKHIASFEYPEPEPADSVRPRLLGMGKTLSRFRGATSQCRPLGRGKRKSLGNAEKYEFEPESRLEGLRGRRRRSRK